MSQIYKISNGEATPIDASQLVISGKRQIPELKNLPIEPGELGNVTIPRLQRSKVLGDNLWMTAITLQKEHPDTFDHMNSLITEGKPLYAELILRTEKNYPGDAETASFALQLDPDEKKISILVEKLREKKPLTIGSELDKLMKNPEPPKLEKPKTPGAKPSQSTDIRQVIPVQVKTDDTLISGPTNTATTPNTSDTTSVPTMGEPTTHPKPDLIPKGPEPTDAVKIESSAEDIAIEQIHETFTGENTDKAFNAFAESANELSKTQIQNAFTCVKKLSSYLIKEEQQIQFFEHMMKHPKAIDTFADEKRIDAGSAIHRSFFMAVNFNDETQKKHSQELFQSIFIRPPEDFEKTTSPQIEQSFRRVESSQLLARNSSYRFHTLRLILQYPETLTNLARNTSALPQLLATLNQDTGDTEAEKRLWKAMETDKLAATQITNPDTSNKAIVLLDHAGRESLPLSLVSDPRFLSLIAENDIDPLCRFMKQLGEMPEPEKKIDDYLEATRDPEFGLTLAKPEPLTRILGLLESKWTRIVNTEYLLNPKFIAQPEAQQQTELGKIKQMIDSPELAIEVPPTSSPTATSDGEKPQKTKKKQRSLRPVTTLEGIQIPNPEVLGAIEYPGSVQNYLQLMNHTFVRKREIDNLNLPYHLTQVVKVLTNCAQQDFKIPTEELHSIMCQHPVTGRIYSIKDTGEGFLTRHLRELESRGVISTDEGGIGLSSKFVNVGETPELTPQAEVALTRIASQTGRTQKEHEINAKILITCAKSPNYLINRNEILEGFDEADKKLAKSRIDSLEDHGLLVNPEPGQNLRMLSPKLIKNAQEIIGNADHMIIPILFTKEYGHVTDPVKRVTGMYYLECSETEKPSDHFNPRLQSRGYAIDHAVELMSGKKAGEEILSRRKTLVRLLSNIHLNLNHGSKLEAITEKAKQAELTGSQVSDTLANLVKAGIVERVALGYYRVGQKYWKNTPPGYGQIGYAQNPPLDQWHENIDSGKTGEPGLLQDVDSAFRTSQQKARALKVLKLLSHTNKTRLRAARTVELRDLLQMEGYDVSESQIRSDLTALTKQVLPDDIMEGRTNTAKHLTQEYTYEPLVEHQKEHKAEVYWQLKNPTTNMRSKEAVKQLPDNASHIQDIHAGKPLADGIEGLRNILEQQDEQTAIDFVELPIPRVDSDHLSMVAGIEKYDYAYKIPDGKAYGIKLWKPHIEY